MNAVENMLEEDKEAVRGIAERLYIFGYGRGDVAEVFSPPRIASQAQSVGLRPGFSIDLGTRKPNGERWDLTLDEDIQLAKEMIWEEECLKVHSLVKHFQSFRH